MTPPKPLSQNKTPQKDKTKKTAPAPTGAQQAFQKLLQKLQDISSQKETNLLLEMSNSLTSHSKSGGSVPARGKSFLIKKEDPYKLLELEAWDSWIAYWNKHGSPCERRIKNGNEALLLKTVQGLSLPKECYGQIINRTSRLSGGNLGILQTFISQKYPLEKVEWLLKAGFDPNWYDGRVTAVGVAAYTGNVEALELFHRWGADLELILKADHCNDPNMINSTLLFRVVDRGISQDKKLPVVEFLARHATLPLQPCGDGRTVFDCLDKGAVAVVKKVFSEREKSALLKTPTKKTSPQKTKRL